MERFCLIELDLFKFYFIIYSCRTLFYIECMKELNFQSLFNIMTDSMQHCQILFTAPPDVTLFLSRQAEASRARDQVLAQVSAAREALDREEQRVLEEVQREQERVEQCLLTQRAHWSQALGNLSQTRVHLVHTLTHTSDAQLVVRGKKFAVK